MTGSDTLRRTVSLLFALLLIVVPLASHAQNSPAPDLPADAGLLRVFLDCNRCDDEFLRQNVGFVDYVRDRASADFHILVTTQETGGGGLSWTVRFIGANRFAARDHTLSFDTDATATSDDQRRAFARIFKLGLVSDAAATSAAPALDVTWRAPTTASSLIRPRDPWNYWVITLNTNGDVNGEKSSSSKSYNMRVSTDRTTEALKVSFSVRGNLRENSFEVGDGETLVTRTHSWDIKGRAAKSLGRKWAVGASGSVSASSFSNIDRSIGGGPAIEYNFFPYSESTRRTLTLQYALGATRYQYGAVTIFDQIEETVPRQAVDVGLNLRQPWGSLGVFSSFAQHLRTPSRYHAEVFAEADVRLFKGLSFNVFTEYTKIKDQIALRKQDASQEEVLLRLRQLATGYSYYVSFGISYRFGSIFNNVVNTRMDHTDF